MFTADIVADCRFKLLGYRAFRQIAAVEDFPDFLFDFLGNERLYQGNFIHWRSCLPSGCGISSSSFNNHFDEPNQDNFCL